MIRFIVRRGENLIDIRNKDSKVQDTLHGPDHSPFRLTDVLRRKENSDQIDGTSEVSFTKLTHSRLRLFLQSYSGITLNNCRFFFGLLKPESFYPLFPLIVPTATNRIDIFVNLEVTPLYECCFAFYKLVSKRWKLFQRSLDIKLLNS